MTRYEQIIQIAHELSARPWRRAVEEASYIFRVRERIRGEKAARRVSR